MTDDVWRAHGAHGTLLQERQVRLESVLTSPAAARRLVRDALGAAGRSAWSDAGELAISELVTNAALHAHTEIDLRLEVFDDRLCVEVRDFNPMLPVQRNYDDHATTGRGMGLVATIALSCGVHSLGEDGKIAWFCVGEPDERTAEELLDAWDLDGLDGSAETVVEDGQRTVVLPSMPITLWLATREHHDALLRELVLYMAERPGIEADVALADQARGAVSTVVAAIVEEAMRRGDVHPIVPAGHPSPLPNGPADLDIEISVAADAGPAFAALQDVLDLAEELAVDDELFVRPGLPEIIAARDWVCDQVIAQLAGSPPAAWGGTAHARFETDVRDRATPGLPEWDASLVTAATTGAIAADDANRIVAVSASLAEVLGWEVDELVGRRVVTVIPPALREAHVAGFSRHLSTGEAHALDVPLELPVLRIDGTEVLCRFLVERAPANPGRAVYVAWIDPLD